MKVSIIIPIFNVEPYIADCLQSVMDQTMTEGVECILVDDCGQDNSIQISEQMIAEYHGSIQFSILHHKKNKGLSEARNTGIRVARGEYLYFLDSDDTITNDCIASMWHMVDRYPGVDVVFAGAVVSDNSKCQWMDYSKKSLPDYSSDANWIREGMLRRRKFSMTAWNKLIKRIFVNENNLLFDEGYIHEDEIWNFRISQKINSAVFLRHNTYNYLIRDKSIMRHSDDANIMIGRKLKMWNRLCDILSKNNNEVEVKAIFTQVCEEQVYWADNKILRKDVLRLLLRLKSSSTDMNAKLLILLYIVLFSINRRLIYNRIMYPIFVNKLMLEFQ